MILNDKNKTIYFLLFLASLFFSFFYGENSSGGAKLDHAITKSYVDNFALGYDTGFKYFGNQIHSPFFYILLAETKKIFSPNILSIIYIFISSSIPIIFYLTLKKKFSRVNTNTLFALSLLIFFSPYFRSSAVWLTNDNLALLFFVLSINKYVHFTEVQNKKFQNFILCLFFLILASYIRQNYAIFSVFYFVKAFNIFSKKEVLYAFIFCLFLSIPEFIFLKYMYSSKNFYSSELILRADYFLNLLAFLTIYFFYIFPIFLSQNMWIQLFNFYKRNYIITFLIISLFLFYLSNYNIPQSAFTFGNGVFFKISNILEIKFIIYIISLLSIILIIFYNENKIENFILLICVFYMNPWFVIFQKYFDPMLSIIFFTLINSDFISKNIIQEKLNLKILYIFNISFLIFANYYYILIK